MSVSTGNQRRWSFGMRSSTPVVTPSSTLSTAILVRRVSGGVPSHLFARLTFLGFDLRTAMLLGSVHTDCDAFGT